LDFGLFVRKANIVFMFKNFSLLQTFDYKKESHAKQTTCDFKSELMIKPGN